MNTAPTIIRKAKPGLFPQACDHIRKLLDLLAARNANQLVIDKWCIKCARIGAVLHVEKNRCDCECHAARRFLAEQEES